jgi:hypothetical protein
METSDILILGLFGAGAFAVYHFMNAQSVPATDTTGSGTTPDPTTPQIPYDPNNTGQENYPYYSDPSAYYPAPSPYQSTSPMGMRYNNPGNLRPGGKEAHYSSMNAGITAAMNNVLAYSHIHGLNTVSGIINRWAPPSENNTGAYVNFVAGRLGVGPYQTITVTDPQTMYELLMAIFYYENGGKTPAASAVHSVVWNKLGKTAAIVPGQGWQSQRGYANPG